MHKFEARSFSWLDQVIYEHLKNGGPKLWSILLILYFRMFYSIEIPQSLKLELLLPLFKDKGTKASNKDNYQFIVMFSVFFVRFLNFSFQEG